MALTGKRTRPKQVKFWTTEEEFNAIKEKVYESKLTQNEYLLRTALDKNIMVIDGLKDIMLELSREGNILNNLAQNKSIENSEIIEMKQRLHYLWGLIEDTLRSGREE